MTQEVVSPDGRLHAANTLGKIAEMYGRWVTVAADAKTFYYKTKDGVVLVDESPSQEIIEKSVAVRADLVSHMQAVVDAIKALEASK